ncbi:RHS repeat-associated core domain-containing protein [Spongiactinospora sp. TRM90649]|uniref:RHS repeat-associated core domain-containing protein n=1 Tax=Spongiactinospora sp. TRM90649 TaxID=3031114 RepID=UPI0023FA44FF|nr:RHS repeat-associated core domain-containing protein [Spongiactinospora sp. TRM90649]MDF5755100.1 RHS repeat-associated core domain-containing protein [Spongiactinospora sp. TRM90649]
MRSRAAKPYRRLLATVTALAVGLSAGVAAQGPVKPSAAASVEAGKPKPQDPERVVKGGPLRAKALPPRTRTPQPAVTWPAAGVTDVDLDGSAPAVRAGTQVVRLRPAERSAAAVSPRRLRLRTHDRAVAARVGVAGPVFSLSRTLGSAPVAAVTAAVDYAAFGEGFGGAFGSRLRLARLPHCALVTPQEPRCATATPLKTVNDTETKTLTARLEFGSAAAGEPLVFAAVAGPSGDKGDFGATPLAASATWQVSTQSGDFTWSYPMRVPPVPGGLVPVLAVNYSSASIDGRTASTNNQGSWVGDGFELSPGHIERKYKACKDDGVPKDPTYQVHPADQCWGYDNATLTMGGIGGELIATGPNTWKVAKDNGTKVERLTGTDANTGNGDNDNEYWRVTTSDGTRYYFGKNRLSEWTEGRYQTNSTWTTPVFGNDDGDECHRDTFKDSWCQQAWRWNLDYIEDVHGNAVVFHYAKESNRYARNLRAADDTPYTRGGYLTAIDYGLRGDDLFPERAPARVEFGNAERCIRAAAADCAESNIATDPHYWPDVPWDLNCAAGTECKDGKGTASPSFWTRKRLAKITTKVLNAAGTGYRNVDSWTFTHDWGTADIDRQLLLTDITHTGEAGQEPVRMPPVRFVYTNGMHNRVDELGDDVGPLIKQRVGAVQNETGGVLDINYTTQDCAVGDTPSPQSNHRRCFPVYWVNANGGADPSLDWFHKYVVAELVQTDLVGGSPDMVTRYDYSIGKPSWRYTDDDGLTPDKFKTWSQWRGFDKVRTIGGATGTNPSQTDQWFFQGMHGDRLDADGGAKTVTVADGEGASYQDHESLQGMLLRTVTYDRAGGTPVSKAVQEPWHHQTASRTRPWGTMTANLTGTESTRAMTLVGSTWQETRTSVLSFDLTTGTPLITQSLGDIAVTGDEQCVTTTNTEAGARVLAMPAQVRTVARPCGQTPDLSRDLISDLRNHYDGGAVGVAPTRGDVTAVEEAKSATPTAVTYHTTARSTYDGLGRPTGVTDVADRTSRTVYTDANGLTVKVDTITPPAVAGDADSALKTTRELDPAWGIPLKETDPGGKTTIAERDALGRTSKVWSAGRSITATPDNQFSYLIRDNAVNAVETKVITNGGGQQSSFVLLDGWLRPRQAQGPSLNGTTRGRTVADTFYNENGQVDHTFDSYYADGQPQPVLFGVTSIGDVESQQWSSYDGRGRITAERLLVGNSDGAANEKWRTTYTYGGNWSKVTPPAGETPITTYTDVHGRTTEVRQHNGDDSVSTRYTYDPRGQRATVTGPDDQVWSYEYDLRGRLITTVDPDRGTERVQYNDLDLPVLSTDGRNRKIGLEYDGLDRAVAKYDATTSSPGTKLVEFTYDTVRKGLLTSASRIVAGQRYTNQVDIYDNLNRPQRTRVVLPANEGALAPAGGYVFDTAYNLDGTVSAASSPAAGDLPAENLTFTYDEVGRLLSTKSPLSTYITGTDYSKTGKVIGRRMQSGAAGKQVDQTFGYEFGTGRLVKATTSHSGTPGTDRSAEYRYQDGGNVTQITDTSRGGVDNQCFRYDELSRLTEAWSQGAAGDCAPSPGTATIGGPAPYRVDYTYDDSGNRRSETAYGAGPSGGTAQGSRDYAYAGMSGVDSAYRGHQLASVTGTVPGAGAETHKYDASGNTTERRTQASNQLLDWDVEGELSKVTDSVHGDTSFVYAADGSRLIRRDAKATTLYLPGLEVRLAKNATAATATRYYDGAMRTASGVTFLVTDHHGTGELAIDATTGALAQRRYTPFGQIRASSNAWPTANEKGFVGGTIDAATGLTTLGARSYDPNSGRFISVDPLITMGDSQGMNGYNYANNNPVNLSDPDGLSPCCAGYACFKIIAPPCKPHQYASRDCEGICDRGGVIKNIQQRRTELDGERQRQRQIARQNAIKQALKVAGMEFLMDFLRINDIKGCFKGSIGSCASLILEAVPAAKIGRLIWKLTSRIKMAIKIYKRIQKAVKTATEVLSKLDNQIKKLDDKLSAFKRADDLPSGGCPGNSFLPGTQVLMADGKRKPIEQVKMGDKVIATDPKTGRTEAKPVTDTITGNGDKKLITVTVATRHGEKDIVATDGHPFWVPERRAWVNAGALHPGMWLRTSAGTHVQITAIKRWTATSQRAHNLTVADFHTYYVVAGDQAILVHNGGRDDDYLYRGVPEGHWFYGLALRGIAVPRGGHTDPARHNGGNTQSVFTSWTTDLDGVARDAADEFGPPGIVLRINRRSVAANRVFDSPDIYDESEVLIAGVQGGAEISIGRGPWRRPSC